MSNYQFSCSLIGWACQGCTAAKLIKWILGIAIFLGQLEQLGQLGQLEIKILPAIFKIAKEQIDNSLLFSVCQD